MSGKTDEALALFDQLVKDNPGFVEARFNRGVALLRVKKFEQASADFDYVMSVPDGPLKARAAFHRALCSQATGDLEGAERLLRRAIETDSEFIDAQLYLGTILEARGKFEEAGKAYRAVLLVRPDSLIAMLRFGISALRAGFNDTALTYLRRVVDAAPESLEAVEAQKYLVLLE